jgi:proteic killer suppression protein
LRFVFRSKKLQRLYTDEAGAERYPSEVVDAFFDKMAIIAAANHENDLRALKGLHFEKLKGERGNRGHYSLRLNKQYRLTLTIETDREGVGKLLCILDIEDYH